MKPGSMAALHYQQAALVAERLLPVVISTANL